MKKKITLLLCMILSIFALSACSSEKEDVTPVAGKDELQTSITSMLLTYNEYSDPDLEAYAEQVAGAGYETIASMLRSLASARAEAGSYRSVKDDWEILYREGAADISVTTEFENRNVILHMTVEEAGSEGAGLEITSAKFTPVYTMGEKLKSAAVNSLFGIATVALILTLMVGIISCFRIIPVLERKAVEKKRQEIAANRPEPGPVQPLELVEEEDLTDDLELVAVITAAIAATEDVPADGLVVRSIRRVSGSKWNRA